MYFLMHFDAIYPYFGSEFLRTPVKQRLLQHLFENCETGTVANPNCKKKAKAMREWCVKVLRETHAFLVGDSG